MNLASVLNVSAPAGAVIQNAHAAEGSTGFDALMETATPSVAPSLPAAMPKGDAAPESQSPVDALVALMNSRDAGAVKMPTTAAAAALPATLAATGLTTEADAPAAQPQPAMDAPPAVRDLALRAAAKVGKDGSADAEKPRTAEPGKGLAAAKQDGKQVNRPVTAAVAMAISKDLVTQTDEGDEELAEPETAAAPADAPSDMAPKAQIAAPVAQPVEAFFKPETAPDRPRPELGTEAPKASEASAKLTTPIKTVQVEPSVQAFTLPTPVVVSAASMTAPIVMGPENFTNHQLDLANDGQWIDQLARDIVAVSGQDGKLRFGLSPSNLGQLEVSVETQQDGVNIQLQASTEAAARIFSAEQPKLIEELRQSGVRVANGDLLGGQQMQGQRDQSHPQNSASRIPTDLTSNLVSKRTSPNNQNTSPNGRFA
ncbi:flagellar hook-length control protein FliK [Sphingorhabdus contaminans]|uniref:Flagellar hook-length control protein FliK n=1 Tax=Sphingorhabdus contaminans TaxID=1343899 RepID=A0A553WA32_9SPHN|nr:flagellar hook-length control protein FliK [Sphingorhabdus contaminans]TSB01543.1 flagellar hook-length control protein FliK [Sphingorhabdus contaminans]